MSAFDSISPLSGRLNRLYALLALALFLPVTACGAPLARGERPQAVAAARNEPIVIRVLTYNIRHGEGRDRQIELVRTAELMKSVQPDIIALQEVDRWTDRSGGVDQLEQLAALMGMHAEFGKAIDYGGGDYGVAVLSRWPIESFENRALPSSEYYEQRTALSVKVRVGEHGPLLLFTSAHLSTSREVGDALGQATRLNELLGTSDDLSSILAGDFNAGVDSDIMQVLQGAWTVAVPAPLQPNPSNPPVSPAPTEPTVASAPQASIPAQSAPSGPTVSGAPQSFPPGAGPGPNGPGRGRGGGSRNDYVLFRPADRWRVVESRFIDDTVASDHRPVLTVLEWVGRVADN